MKVSKRKIATAFLLSIVASSSVAQFVPVSDLVACQEIENIEQRLDCYEALTGVIEGDEPATREDDSQPDAQPWIFLQNTDPINGTDTSRAYLDATRKLNGNDSPEYLMMRCDGSGSFELFIGTGGYIGGRRDRVAMEYRWNEDAPISESWSDSTNGKAAFLPRGYRDFLRGLREGGDLVVRWQDYRGNSYASLWENIRLDEKANFILDGC
ncbi:MAG: hypothetical protein KIH44_004265 [Octadecabacter sp.]|nr:hypothetical protein [Octadecabacter sp.]